MAFCVAFILVPATLTVGAWLIDTSRRHCAHRSCSACGYDLSGHLPTAQRCSECGVAFSEQPPHEANQTVHRTGRAIAGYVLVIISLVGLSLGGFLLNVLLSLLNF